MEMFDGRFTLSEIKDIVERQPSDYLYPIYTSGQILSVKHDEIYIQYLKLLLSEKQSLSILDHGGSYGEHFINVFGSIFEKENIKKYIIIEDKRICENIKNRGNIDNVEYRFSINNIDLNQKFDIIHSNSAIQYCWNDDKIIEKFCLFSPKYILLLRVPITLEKQSFYSLQGFLEKKIPYKFFSFVEIYHFMKKYKYKEIYNENHYDSEIKEKFMNQYVKNMVFQKDE